MESATAKYVVDRVDAEGYEPDIIDGTQVGEFRGLEPKGGSANDLDVGVWRSDPAIYDYLFESDEAFHVVAGAATVELPDTGERIELRVGDIAYFSAGTRSVGQSRSRSRSSWSCLARTATCSPPTTLRPPSA